MSASSGIGNFGRPSWYANVDPAVGEGRAMGSFMEEAVDMGGDVDASDSLSDLGITMTFGAGAGVGAGAEVAAFEGAMVRVSYLCTVGLEMEKL